MIAILAVIAILCLWGVRFSPFHEDYCAKEPTTAIKGVLALIILTSHIRGYILLQPTTVNHLFLAFFQYLDQSMGALYFFYSGFGICQSLKHKKHYRNHFLKNRFLKTLLHFDLAVLLYVLASFIPRAGHLYPLKNYLFCWTGWESVGNSNWFMFVILALYLIAFAMMWTREGWMALKVLIPTVILWIILYFIHMGQYWWYDTLLTFPLGMLFAEVKSHVDQALRKPLFWWLSFLGLAVTYIGTHHLIGVDQWGIVNCIFCLLIVVGSMKVQIGNPVLKWLGINAFAIYILQRLPMNILSGFGLNGYVAVFVPLAIALSFLLAWGFTMTTDRIDRKLFQRS